MSSLNLDGQRFGELTVCGDCIVNDNGQREWYCICSHIHGYKVCCNSIRVLETDLLSGNVLDCGCHQAEMNVSNEEFSTQEIDDPNILRRRFSELQQDGIIGENQPLARPKTGRPPKHSLNLTVNEKTMEILISLSEQRGMSIDALVEEWAVKEAQKEDTGI